LLLALSAVPALAAVGDRITVCAAPAAITFDALTGPGTYEATPQGLFATSTVRLRIKNTHGSLAKQICYQYVETK
jgi:hypothetical protein